MTSTEFNRLIRYKNALNLLQHNATYLDLSDGDVARFQILEEKITKRIDQAVNNNLVIS